MNKLFYLFIFLDEKETLLFRLQHTQTLISGYESEKKSLLDEISSLENQLTDVIEDRKMVIFTDKKLMIYNKLPSNLVNTNKHI